jgi:RNA polymerase sigma factor (sigma-70 family)
MLLCVCIGVISVTTIHFESRAGEDAEPNRVLPVVPARGDVPRHIDDRLTLAASRGRQDDAVMRNLLFDAYWPRLRRTCSQVWRRTCRGTIVDRDDVDQEAFLVFASLLERWPGDGSFARYLLGLFPWRLRDAVDVLIGPRDASLADLSLAELADVSYDTEQAVVLLEDLSRQFPPLDRQILLMRVRDGVAVRQIADTLGINRRTVQRRMAAMRSKLREDLMARTGRDD